MNIQSLKRKSNLLRQSENLLLTEWPHEVPITCVLLYLIWGFSEVGFEVSQPQLYTQRSTLPATMSSLGCVLSVQQQQNFHLTTPNSSPKAEGLTVSRSRSLSRRSTPSSLEGGRSYDGLRAGGSADSGCVTPNEVLSGSDLARENIRQSAKLQANNNNTIDVPEYIIDRQTKITYLKGKFLGKVSE